MSVARNRFRHGYVQKIYLAHVDDEIWKRRFVLGPENREGGDPEMNIIYPEVRLGQENVDSHSLSFIQPHNAVTSPICRSAFCSGLRLAATARRSAAYNLRVFFNSHCASSAPKMSLFPFSVPPSLRMAHAELPDRLGNLEFSSTLSERRGFSSERRSLNWGRLPPRPSFISEKPSMSERSRRFRRSGPEELFRNN